MHGMAVVVKSKQWNVSQLATISVTRVEEPEPPCSACFSLTPEWRGLNWVNPPAPAWLEMVFCLGPQGGRTSMENDQRSNSNFYVSLRKEFVLTLQVWSRLAPLLQQWSTHRQGAEGMQSQLPSTLLWNNIERRMLWKREKELYQDRCLESIKKYVTHCGVFL